MVFLVLSIKADLENVATLAVPKKNRFCFDVQSSDGGETREGARLNDLMSRSNSYLRLLKQQYL